MLAGVAEKNPHYQQVIKGNNPGHLEHMWGELGAMLTDKPCTLHAGSCSACHVPSEINLGVTGSPCNPFSQYRTKRFSDGAVCHSMYKTTSEDVVGFYTKYEPHCGITEQVKGFGMPTSQSDQETPMKKPLCVQSN